MIIKNARVYTEDRIFLEKDIIIENEVFVNINEFEGEVIDATGCYAIPGLVDIHLHGCVGYDFCDGTLEAIQNIAEYEAINGITAIAPATMTYDEDKLRIICDTAREYNVSGGSIRGADLVGINMEGPFLSYEKRGAQNPDYLDLPNIEMYDRLQVASGGLIKIVDVAPELEGTFEFINKKKDEVRISIAHTTADYDTTVKAFEAGATHVTHLYNAMNSLSHRNPGPIAAAADKGADVELITDGVHIHPAMVRLTFRMFGSDKIVLISDSMMATGLDDGDYSLGGQAVKVVGNLATLEGGTIAGSATNLMDCLRNAIVGMGIKMEDAIASATINPAACIGIDDMYGSIKNGKYANLVLLSCTDLSVVKVILKGRIL